MTFSTARRTVLRSVGYRRTLAPQGLLDEVSVRFELGLGAVMVLFSPV